MRPDDDGAGAMVTVSGKERTSEAQAAAVFATGSRLSGSRDRSTESCCTSGRRAGTARRRIRVRVVRVVALLRICQSFHPFPHRSVPYPLSYPRSRWPRPLIRRQPIHKSLACPEGRIIFPFFPTSLPYLCLQSSFQEQVRTYHLHLHSPR
jgi:hypothetical protein